MSCIDEACGPPFGAVFGDVVAVLPPRCEMRHLVFDGLVKAYGAFQFGFREVQRFLATLKHHGAAYPVSAKHGVRRLHDPELRVRRDTELFAGFPDDVLCAFYVWGHVGDRDKALDRDRV